MLGITPQRGFYIYSYRNTIRTTYHIHIIFIHIHLYMDEIGNGIQGWPAEPNGYDMIDISNLIVENSLHVA